MRGGGVDPAVPQRGAAGSVTLSGAKGLQLPGHDGEMQILRFAQNDRKDRGQDDIHWNFMTDCECDQLEETMKLSESLLPEFDREMANTRKVLERVPEDKLTWKPHAKSFSMGALATHVAMIPGWGVFRLAQDSFDLAAPGAQQPPPPAGSRKELLELFDRNVAAYRAALVAADDARLFAPWSLVKGSQTIFTMPRLAVLRSIVMNHSIHHRAQLGVYLRLNDVPVPAIYGPSADEG